MDARLFSPKGKRKSLGKKKETLTQTLYPKLIKISL
jgi:hypothetical protein